MSANLIHANQGTPITLLVSNQYQNWLNQQNPFVQNWLSHFNPQETNHCTIPDSTGQVIEVIVVLDQLDELYLAADLPSKLPPQQFLLNASRLSEAESPSAAQSLSLRFAISWGLASYKFERYKKASDCARLAFDSEHDVSLAKRFVDAITLTRDLINTPASDMMPEQLAQQTQLLAEEFGATFTQLVGDQLLEQNYPMIHAVGRASICPPRLLDLQWGDPSHPKVTLVGKGVCFDSGGLNIKTGNFMRLMKKDMGGAAHVLGLARLVMAQQLPIRLRVLIPAVENAVSDNAFRPGDVISTRKGLNVEIDNTDAEGRLVLCDALEEADSESPDLLIDFATLTGACRVALGTELPGYFCNHKEIARELYEQGEQVFDPVWQLPLHRPYRDMLKSDIADTLNSSATGYGGAITAALYLELFVSERTPWIHFDVMAWNNRKLPGRPIGGEAFGLRAAYALLEARYPAKQRKDGI